MSQNYEWKYNHMRGNNPTSKNEKTEPDASEIYPEAGYNRVICFVWMDGRKTFLNYSYLISGDYLPEENTIQLAFTSHQVTIKGIKLDGLFDKIMQQTIKVIVCTDARYNELSEENKYAINDIILSAMKG